jgi:hypothetical protein
MLFVEHIGRGPPKQKGLSFEAAPGRHHSLGAANPGQNILQQIYSRLNEGKKFKEERGNAIAYNTLADPHLLNE